MINVGLLDSVNTNDLSEVYAIWSSGYYGTSLEDFKKAINDNCLVLIAKDGPLIVGICILSFYIGRQMWSNGERLCDIEFFKIIDTLNYKEIVKSLYDMAISLSNDRGCIKTAITDFSDQRLFSVLDLDYDKCRCEYHLTH